MRIAYSLDDFRRFTLPSVRHVATIGNFDGVHRGHRELIRVTREKAAAARAAPVLMTFDPHPVHVVCGMEKHDTLTPLPRKLELLADTGIDTVLVLPFTPEMAVMTAENFVHTFLVNGLAVSELVMGYNFALGKNREGNLTALSLIGETNGFTVTQVPPVVVEGETVSSSLVREHIKSGNLSKVSALLGRMHSIDGEVIHGEGRGHTLGFPTANISFANMLLPPLGVYSTWLQVLDDNEVPRMSMTSVGTNPTFNGTSLTVETHVLDYSKDVYGKTVRLFFAEHLRSQIAFNGPKALVERLALDAKAVREQLSRIKKETFS